MKNLDAYKQFFEICSKETFFDFGLNNIITIDREKTDVLWGKLKADIINKNNNIYIRDSSRRGSGNTNLSKMYKSVFGIDVKYDPTNNSIPTKILQNHTGYRKNKNIFNYQVSHVFGNTKNIFCFTAPWNIVFIPKLIDPLTGHEAKGDYVIEFQEQFKKYIYEQFTKQINEYNELIKEWNPKIEKWINNNLLPNEKDKYLKEFQKIEI